MSDPYQDYDPKRAKYQGVWFGISFVALLVLSGLIYFAAHLPDNVASSDATRLHPQTGNSGVVGNTNEPGTTGSGEPKR
jgi:hypothetical protein